MWLIEFWLEERGEILCPMMRNMKPNMMIMPEHCWPDSDAPHTSWQHLSSASSSSPAAGSPWMKEADQRLQHELAAGISLYRLDTECNPEMRAAWSSTGDTGCGNTGAAWDCCLLHCMILVMQSLNIQTSLILTTHSGRWDRWGKTRWSPPGWWRRSPPGWSWCSWCYCWWHWSEWSHILTVSCDPAWPHSPHTGHRTIL